MLEHAPLVAVEPAGEDDGQDLKDGRHGVKKRNGISESPPTSPECPAGLEGVFEARRDGEVGDGNYRGNERQCAYFIAYSPRPALLTSAISFSRKPTIIGKRFDVVL